MLNKCEQLLYKGRSRVRVRTSIKLTWDWIYPLELTTWGTLGELISLSKPQFPHCNPGAKTSPYFTVLVGKVNEMEQVICIAQHLVQKTYLSWFCVSNPGGHEQYCLELMYRSKSGQMSTWMNEWMSRWMDGWLKHEEDLSRAETKNMESRDSLEVFLLINFSNKAV